MKQALLVSLFLCTTVFAQDKWTPPPNPDPEVILDEASADAEAGRFEDALAKHVWFHDNALKHRPSLYGVRLSFAIADWYELGRVYPPALERLKQTRDSAAKLIQIHENMEDVRDSFHDVSSINRQLGDGKKTLVIFERLHNERPELAEEVYDIALPTLVANEKYALIGEYLKPKKSYFDILRMYEFQRDYAKEKNSLERRTLEMQIAEENYLQGAGTLIALLVLNERIEEAEEIAKKVKATSRDSRRDQVVDAALDGKLPELGFYKKISNNSSSF